MLYRDPHNEARILRVTARDNRNPNWASDWRLLACLTIDDYYNGTTIERASKGIELEPLNMGTVFKDQSSETMLRNMHMELEAQRKGRDEWNGYKYNPVSFVEWCLSQGWNGHSSLSEWCDHGVRD